MPQVSPQTVYDNLRLMEHANVVTSACYRKMAQDVLADPEVSLKWRLAISDRLLQANHWLEMRTVQDNDSY
jgi:hypothetical protein